MQAQCSQRQTAACHCCCCCSAVQVLHWQGCPDAVAHRCVLWSWALAFCAQTTAAAGSCVRPSAGSLTQLQPVCSRRCWRCHQKNPPRHRHPAQTPLHAQRVTWCPHQCSSMGLWCMSSTSEQPWCAAPPAAAASRCWLLTNFDRGHPQPTVFQQHAYAAGCDTFPQPRDHATRY